jgi:hypothetical protein
MHCLVPIVIFQVLYFLFIPKCNRSSRTFPSTQGTRLAKKIFKMSLKYVRVDRNKLLSVLRVLSVLSVQVLNNGKNAVFRKGIVTVVDFMLQVQ